MDVPFVRVSMAGDNFFPISYSCCTCSFVADLLSIWTLILNCCAPGLTLADSPENPLRSTSPSVSILIPSNLIPIDVACATIVWTMQLPRLAMQLSHTVGPFASPENCSGKSQIMAYSLPLGIVMLPTRGSLHVDLTAKPLLHTVFTEKVAFAVSGRFFMESKTELRT